MRKAIGLFVIGFLGLGNLSSAQNTFLKVATYVGIVHPIATYSNNKPQYNFEDHYTVGTPVGINIWKSQKTGFSLEMVPYIRSEEGTSKMSNFLFHPGVLVSLGNGFTFAGRAAFETAGRYGFTPVFNKVVKKNKNSGYFLALPFPCRFGNDKPASFTLAIQFGLIF